MDYLKKLSYLKRYSKFQHRTKLIYFLTVLQLVAGIFLLTWFFAPQGQTMLTAQPKAYSVQNFKPGIRYLVAKSDLIGGVATPSAYVKVILKEPKITLRAKADSQGNWLIKIPEKIPEKAYQMQVIAFDSKGKNPRVKLVKVKVESNNLVYQSKAYKNLKNWTQRIFSI